MALAFVQTPVTAAGNGLATGTSLLFFSAPAVGNGLVVVLAFDNVDTTDVQSTRIASMATADAGASPIQSLTKIAEFTNGQGAAAAGVTVSMWKLDEITGSSPPRLNVSTDGTSLGKFALTSGEFSKTAGTPILVQTFATLANDGADVGAINLGTLPSREYLLLFGIGAETSVTTGPTLTNYTAFSTAATSGGSAATNVGARGLFRIVTTTAANENPTSGAGNVDHATIYAALYEGAGGTPHSASPADALAITDQVTISIGRALTVNDPLTIADAPSSTSTFQRQVDDALAVTDTPTPALGLARTLDDALAIADNALAEKILPVAIDDALGVTDAVAQDRGLGLADALGITDAVRFDRAVAIADALGITDTPAALIAIAKTIDDALAITDTATPTATLARTIADALAITDQQTFDRGLALADGLGITDNVAAAIILLVELADSLGITDTAATARALVRSLDDPLVLTDQASPAATLARAVADALDITDAVVPVHTPGSAPTWIDFVGALTLELDELVYTLELAELTYTMGPDAPERDLELDEENTRTMELDE
jgi:hypothetical protein